MSHGRTLSTHCLGSSRCGLVAVVALSALLLASCRGPAVMPPQGAPSGWAPGPQGSLPPEAYTGTASPLYAPPQGPPGMEQGVPMPYAVTGPWTPPGLAEPWPKDEYLADGGDQAPATVVVQDESKQVRGLNVEDTVAQYDTLDGRTLVEPSNRVHIYSPRFRSIRQVVGIEQNLHMDQVGDVAEPTRLAGNQRTQGPKASSQRLQLERQVSQSAPITYWMRQGDGALSTAVGPQNFHNGFQLFENFTAIRSGQMLEAEMPFLAEKTNAAVSWTRNEKVQVMLDSQVAAVEQNVDKVSILYTVHTKGTKPKLRIIKVASTQFAEPGDTVDFTIRFDNVGDVLIGNVTILDNLTTRLEYVPDSAQSSVAADFSASPNEASSAVLRWAVTAPVKPGEGGVVRFRCRVR